MRIFYLLPFLLLISCADNTKTCTIAGSVKDIECDSAYLYLARDIHENQTTNVPIVNGEILYTFPFEHIEAYSLKLLQGRSPSKAITFFPREGVVRFEIEEGTHSEDYHISGGKHNRVLKKTHYQYLSMFTSKTDLLNDSINKTNKKNGFDLDEYLELREEFYESTDSSKKDSLNKRAMKLRAVHDSISWITKPLAEKRDSLYGSGFDWLSNGQIHDYSLISYHYFLERLYGVYEVILTDSGNFQYDYESFARLYPGHPYNEIVSDILIGKKQIHIGGKYIDFAAPDLEGKNFKLSELIDGKYAIIDCWYPWCGPCIRKSRKIVPIYSELQEKNFIVVGIAGDSHDIDAIESRLEIEKYPWKTLVAPNVEKPDKLTTPCRSKMTTLTGAK